MSTARPIIGVLALQGGVAEHLAALEHSGAVAKPVRRPDELADLHGVVLPGGESTTMTRLASAFGLYEPLREKLDAGLPAYGSCAGMVLLSSEVLEAHEGETSDAAVRPFAALDIVVRRNAFGNQLESFETALDFRGIAGGPVHGVFIRAPWVDKVGAGVEVLAAVSNEAPHATSSNADIGRIVAVRQGPVLATAFHPELVRGDERVHRHFVRTVRAY